MKKYTKEEVFSLIDSGKKIVIDFWAEWCRPCLSFAPTFEKVSENEDFKDVAFVKVNVDEEKELSEKYGIRSIPTIIFIDKSSQKAKMVGGMSQPQFEKFIADNLS